MSSYIAHKCGDSGIIRPYPSVICNMCYGTKEEDNFTSANLCAAVMGLRDTLAAAQRERDEARREMERLRSSIEDDVIADVNHFDPRNIS